MKVTITDGKYKLLVYKSAAVQLINTENPGEELDVVEFLETCIKMLDGVRGQMHAGRANLDFTLRLEQPPPVYDPPTYELEGIDDCS